MLSGTRSKKHTKSARTSSQVLGQHGQEDESSAIKGKNKSSKKQAHKDVRNRRKESKRDAVHEQVDDPIAGLNTAFEGANIAFQQAENAPYYNRPHPIPAQFVHPTTNHSLPNFPADPAQSFMWGAHNLFAGLSSVNAKLEALELRTRCIEEQRRRLDALRNFIQSVYRQLQAQNDFVRGKEFEAGVQEVASEIVVSKCLPEIWKLRANVKDLSNRLPIKEDTKHPVFSKHTSAVDKVAATSCESLAQEVETLVLRLAALGDQRVHHIEIVGNGKRYQDGTSIRTMVTEDQLGHGSFS